MVELKIGEQIMTKEIKEKIWKHLDSTHLQIHRNSDQTLTIWTPGNMCQNSHDLESFLIQYRIRLVDKTFDRICGKTANIFKGL